jgi:hypothetical protein
MRNRGVQEERRERQGDGKAAGLEEKENGISSTLWRKMLLFV